MSYELPAGAVSRPVAHGMTEGMNLDQDPTQFYYTAYRHPHGPSWFGGTRRRPGRASQNGGWVHYISSSVNHLAIPPKLDYMVAAVNYDMWRDLVQKEYTFWEDYFTERQRLTVVWAQDNHPVIQNPDLLPDRPRSIHLAAIKYAHRQVAVRAGREGDLPADFDEQEFMDEAEEMEWDD